MTQPHPDLVPEQVIQIQVQALQENDLPSDDAGIAVAYAFASPANKAFTGPLDRFTQMVKNPLYRDMLNCQRASFGPIDITGDQARQLVTLLTADYREVSYVFQLSRQHNEPFVGCWMTDAVIVVPAEEL